MAMTRGVLERTCCSRGGTNGSTPPIRVLRERRAGGVAAPPNALEDRLGRSRSRLGGPR
jgi:hypothetical protein